MANVLAELFQDQANAIREGLGDIGKLAPLDFPSKTREIVALIGAGDGDDLDEVNTRLDEINGEIIGAKTVTFMVEGMAYATRKVAPGDTASKPTDPRTYSTVAEVFTFDGWSREDDGTVDYDALVDVTEDRTVYAVFKATPRSYTVSFFDDDGTALHSEKVVYGGSSTYTAEKKGALFQNWNPAPVNISGDLNCYAVWDYVAFSNDDWTTIKEVAQTHKVADHYAKGDTRELTLTYADGSTETVLLELVDVTGGYTLTDDNGNTIGTSGMTIRLRTPLATPMAFVAQDWVEGEEISYLASPIYTYLHDTVIPAMPTDLQEILSVVQREYHSSTGKVNSRQTTDGSAKLWLLTESQARTLDDAHKRLKVYGTDSTVVWWTMGLSSYAGLPAYVFDMGDGTGGVLDMMSSTSLTTTQYHIVFEFYL